MTYRKRKFFVQLIVNFNEIQHLGPLYTAAPGFDFLWVGGVGAGIPSVFFCLNPTTILVVLLLGLRSFSDSIINLMIWMLFI